MHGTRWASVFDARGSTAHELSAWQPKVWNLPFQILYFPASLAPTSANVRNSGGSCSSPLQLGSKKLASGSSFTCVHMRSDIPIAIGRYGWILGVFRAVSRSGAFRMEAAFRIGCISPISNDMAGSKGLLGNLSSHSSAAVLTSANFIA